MCFLLTLRASTTSFHLAINYTSHLITCLASMAFWRGNNTLRVSEKLFATNRHRLVEALRLKQVDKKAVVILQSGDEQPHYNTDHEAVFKQEPYFFWAFGVHEPNCYGVVHVDDGRAALFFPKLHPDYAIWQGAIRTAEYFKQKYGADEVQFHENTAIADYLNKTGVSKLILLKAENTDSGLTLQPAKFDSIDKYDRDTDLLYPIIAELRVFKTDAELDVLRYAAQCASNAHKEVMKHIRPGLFEYQLESLFQHKCYYDGGCRHVAYTCICASGNNSSVLHYGHANAPNDRAIKDGDMCLYDMGPAYNGYASDVTCSFPANGKFSNKQKTIYNAVLAARDAVFVAAKPGIRWTDMHLLAERTILTHLRDAKIVEGDVDAMLEARVGAIFMPHGLGHFLGLDTHDVGGYLGDALPRSTLPGLKSLRVTRTLQERMVITIEPGCYFIDTLLDKALADSTLSKFINKSVLDEYRSFGGVRIEDDVVIWKKGNECMNTVPRTVDEIEAFMAHDRQ